MALELGCKHHLAGLFYLEEEQREDIRLLSKIPSIKSRAIFRAFRSYNTVFRSLFLVKVISNLSLSFAIIVKSKVGNAVARNYIRRRIRSAFNEIATDLKLDGSTSYIFLVKPEAASVDFLSLKQEILSCVKIINH